MNSVCQPQQPALKIRVIKSEYKDDDIEYDIFVNMKGQWVFVVSIRSKIPSYIDALVLMILHASQLI